MKKSLAWSAVTFVLSLLASAVCGRALWCDEILRINGQHYTVAQLFAFKHLHDFCTQTPTGYLFLRPFQLLLGYEFGGCLVSALSAATITLCVLLLIRRFSGRTCGSLAAAVVATNPLLVYYGSEIAFYEMWAAAFAVAFLLLDGLDADRSPSAAIRVRVGFIVAGSLFVTFHFAGMFVWAGLSAVVTVDRWIRRGIRDAFYRGVLMAMPMALNLPMYLGADGKAVHLGSQHAVWSRAPDVCVQVVKYVAGLFSCFTGAAFAGVAVFALGSFVLLRKPEGRRTAVLAVGGILSIVLFLFYSGLHEYIPRVCRYWVYALAPVLFVVAVGIEGVMGRNVCAGTALASVLLLANAVPDLALVLAEGRNSPYRKLVARVAASDSPSKSVAFVNHYERRFFSGYYRLPEGGSSLVPSYWEQGEEARIAGLAQLRGISPLTPVYVMGDSDEKIAAAAGYVSTNVVTETRTVFFDWSVRLGLFPEPSTGAVSSSRLILPLEEELVAAAEASGRPLFVPGKGWSIRQIPPKKGTEPFVSFLALSPRSEGVLRVYVPRSAKRLPVALDGYFGSDRKSSADIGGKPVRLSGAFALRTIDLPSVQVGAWAEIPVRASDSLVALLSLNVR